MMASESAEQVQEAVYQTSVMTEMIFTDFDGFVED